MIQGGYKPRRNTQGHEHPFWHGIGLGVDIDAC